MSDKCSNEYHARVTWTSEAGEPQHVLLRPAAPGEQCAMFHVPITDVSVDSISGVWREGPEAKAATHGHTNDNAHDNTHEAAELACGHVFNTCALAVHFCTNDMRCPVCRRGTLHTAEISSFAPAMQSDLARIKLAMHVRETEDNVHESFGVDLNLDALIRDFIFEIFMQWAPVDAPANTRDRYVRLTSPVRLNQLATPASPVSPTTPTTDHYTTHRSFQRKFNLNLKQMEPGHHIMCLGLTHPLMPDAARTPMFDKTALLAAADAGTRITLARNVGFILPVHTDAGLSLTLHLHTDYLAMACVQVMLNSDRQARV